MAVKAILLVAVLMAMLMVESSSALDLCNLSQDELMACKPAVAKFNPTNPSDLCCQALGHANFTCFCDYQKNNSGYLKLLGIDAQRAMKLPGECNMPNTPTC